MKKIIEYLKRLGFSEQEATLYLILLKAGALTVADLAQKANINRTATYGYIDSMLKKGVIAKSKGNSSKIVANPPAYLQYLVEQKINSAQSLKDELDPIVTMLNSSFNRIKDDMPNAIRYFKGKLSVKGIYNEVLRSDEIRSYFNGADIERVFPENFELFNKTFDRNPKVKMYEILEKSPITKKLLASYTGRPRYFYKFLPGDIILTSNDILLYDGKVAIINFNAGNNVEGVILDNLHYYNNSKQVFDLLWRLLPNPVVESEK